MMKILAIAPSGIVKLSQPLVEKNSANVSEMANKGK